MLKKSFYITGVFLLLFTIVTGCNSFGDGEIEKVGMLMENSIYDETWGSKGYEGLLTIKDKFDVDVYFKEGVKNEEDVNRAIKEFADKGVNLIFGHSSSYGRMFEEINEAYPGIHFVYFNGGYHDDNLTSLNFNSHAMGFFSGMVAGKMTETNNVGLIGAFEWQPEIEGFYEGVHYQNPNAEVTMNFVNSWNDSERALQLFNQMAADNVDVFYPTGNSFSMSVIEKARDKGLYAIGYLSDQSSISEKTVLTSTIQHVDSLYVMAAEKFNQGKLDSGILTFDFQDGAISLGKFSPDVPHSFVTTLNRAIETYVETGLLPNEH